jgi:hypothetical protein
VGLFFTGMLPRQALSAEDGDVGAGEVGAGNVAPRDDPETDVPT